MNRYHLGFTLAAGVAIFLLYLDGKPPSSAATEKWPTPAPAAASGGNILPSTAVDRPFTSPANPVSAPPPTAADNGLEPLLAQIETLLQELATLQNLLANTATPELPPDPILEQTYQPRIDELTDQINRLVTQASSLSRPRTERFIWQQALSLGLNGPTALLVLGMVLPITDSGVFTDMLTTLANSSYPGSHLAGLQHPVSERCPGRPGPGRHTGQRQAPDSTPATHPRFSGRTIHTGNRPRRAGHVSGHLLCTGG